MEKSARKQSFVLPLTVGLVLGIFILAIITALLFKLISLFGQVGLVYWFILMLILWVLVRKFGKRL